MCVCMTETSVHAHKQSHYMLGTSHATKYCTCIMTMVSTWSPRSARPEQQGARGGVWCFYDGVGGWKGMLWLNFVGKVCKGRAWCQKMLRNV